MRRIQYEFPLLYLKNREKRIIHFSPLMLYTRLNMTLLIIIIDIKKEILYNNTK